MLKTIVILEGINALMGIVANTFELSGSQLLGMGTIYWNIIAYILFFAGFVVILFNNEKIKREIQDKIYEQIKKDFAGIKNPTKLQDGSLESVSQQDRLLISSFVIEMTTQHGHTDWQGLFADRASGIALNKLMFENCHKCGKPRNQQGEEHYE